MAKTGKSIFSNRYEDTEKPGQGFLKMMLVWHGSVLKLIWLHLFVFIVAYSVLNLLYKHVFMHDEEMRQTFELICIYCSRFSSKIPVTFMVGFYVANVVSRYWDQFISLPWPDRIAFKLVGYLPGQDDYTRTLRRTLMRYLNLSTVLVFRTVSPKVLARFPTYESLVEAGLMLPGEDARLANVDALTDHETSWAPTMWAIHLLQKERTEGRLKIEATIYANIINSFEYLETCNRRIFNHGWVNFPFAYSQVITMVVYTYLLANLFGHQYLEPRAGSSDLFKELDVSMSNSRPYDLHTPVVHVPVFTLIEFIAYLGWIKVAETLLNPWGDDDEDFQVNYLIDRNFQTSMLIIDDALTDTELTPDMYMTKKVPSELPYNKNFRRTESEVQRKAENRNCLSRTCANIRSKFRSNSSVSTADMLKRMNLHTKVVSSNLNLENSGADIPLTSVAADNNLEKKEGEENAN